MIEHSELVTATVGMSMQNIVAYGLLVVVGLMFVGVIILIWKAFKYKREYVDAELPDLDLGFEASEEEEVDETEESSAFTLNFDEEEVVETESEADEMFNLVTQHPTPSRREAREQEKAKKGLFGKFKK